MRLVIKGLKKSKPYVRKAAYPMTPEILEKIGQNMRKHNPFEVTIEFVPDIIFPYVKEVYCM